MKCHECGNKLHVNYPYGKKSSPRIIGHTNECSKKTIKRKEVTRIRGD